ncbi:MAG: serine/threonine-protein kinase [bacterium]|nr:serine/threonine-protein kinase [bacterium]
MSASSDDDRIEELVFDCLEAPDVEAALAAVDQHHPDLAVRVRQIYGRLHAGKWLDSATMPGAVGDVPRTLGAFTRSRELGHGGMGIVFLAHQPELARAVALKVMRPEFLAFADSRERFRREAEAASSLQHPGIVQVFSVGAENNLPYFAMEYIEGGALASRLAVHRGQDPGTKSASDLWQLGTDGGESGSGSGTGTGESTRRARNQTWTEASLAMVRQLAGAIDHAHSRGILHRDIKPSNILIGADGRAMLTDFGLARIEGAQDLTRSTARIGSLPYLPPEYLGPRLPVASASLDIYQLGVVLYELLALDHPFRGEHAEQTRTNILNGRPAKLRHRNRAVHRDLETVCLTAMAIEPAQRYESMAAMRADLDNVAARRPIEARRPGPATRTWRWTQRNPVVAVAAVFALLVAAVAGAVIAGLENSARRTSEALTRETRYELYRANVTAAAATIAQGASAARTLQLLANCPTEFRGFEWYHLAARATDGELVAMSARSEPAATWFGPDDQLATLDPTSRTMTFWRPGQAEPHDTLELPPAATTATQIARSPTAIWLGHRDGKLTRHDPESGAVTATLQHEALHNRPVRALTLLPASDQAVSVHANAEIAIWSLADLTFGRFLGVRQERFPLPVAASADGSALAVCDYRKQRILVFDTATWHERRALSHHWSRTTGLGLDRTGATVFASATGSVFVIADERARWDQLNIRDAGGLAIDAAGRRLAVTESERRIAIYDFDPTRLQARQRTVLAGHAGRVSRLLMASDGNTCVSIGDDLTARRYDFAARGGESRLQHGLKGSVAITALGSNQALVGSSKGELATIDLQSGRATRWQSPHRIWMHTLEVVGERLLTVSHDNQVAVWQLPAGAAGSPTPRPVDTGDHAVTCAALHPNAARVVAGAPDGTVRVWDSDTGTLIDQWQAHEAFVSSIAFAADGSEFLTAAEDGTLRTWRWSSRTRRHDFAGYRGWIGTAIYSGDDEVVAGGQDPRLMIWDRDTGRFLRTGHGHGAPIFCLAATASGDRVFSGDVAREIHIWDRHGDRSLHVCQASHPAVSLAFDDSGQRLLVGHMGLGIDVFSTRTDLPGVIDGPHRSSAGNHLKRSVLHRMIQQLPTGK